MTTIILNLPMEKPPLTANQRPHWAEKAQKTAQLRDMAFWCARSANLPKGLKRVKIQLHWVPNVNRRRDPSNLMPTQKALIDGLVEGAGAKRGYGLVPDDCPPYVLEEIPEIHPVEEEARMWLEIEVLA